jgi:biopolymer transport protein ExbD
MKFEQKQKRLTTFTAISLTDIVLLLLIFFLLSSSFIVQPGIKVELPKSQTAAAEASGKIYVTVTKRATIFVNGERVSKRNLGEKIHDLLRKQPDQMVVLQADRNLSLEKTVEILDIIKLAGAQKFLIATRPS